MMVGLLLGLLADLVFDSAARAGRAFGRDMERYLRDGSAVPVRTPTPLPAR
jgi:hypothetical protein